MVFGPCGGVRPDGACEMRPHPCVFDGPVPWPDPVAAAPADVPLVLADFSAPPFDLATATRLARTMAEHCGAVLVGEHSNRPDLPPTLLASALLDAGATPWITLSCRERNRVVLEQELHGLASVGVRTVLCVTGDGRGYDVRPDVTQVFDLDGPRLASLAAATGLTAAVPETPTAPPVGGRPQRLVQKQRAGASVAVLNHVASAAALADFVAAARAAGLTVPVVAGVAVYTDVASAAVLDALPGLHLDRGVVDAVVTAPDPFEAGVAAAVDVARELLAIEGVAGVNLSGSAVTGDPMAGAEVKAEIARRLASPV
ncbi:methylenetetrahydrofolate reductase [Jatrophihabitans fulvus]